MTENIHFRLQNDVQDEKSQSLLLAVNEVFNSDDQRVLELKNFMSGFEDSSWNLICTPGEAYTTSMLVLREQSNDLYGRQVTFVRVREKSGNMKWRVAYSRLLVDELKESEDIPFKDPSFERKHFYMNDSDATVFASKIMRVMNILRGN